MPIEAQLVLCDAAESVNGKLYILGGGWSRIPIRDAPLGLTVAIVLVVPAAEASGMHQIQIDLLDSDNEPVLGDDGPVAALGQIQFVEPPLGDDVLTATAVATIAGLRLDAGSYFVRLLIDDDAVATARFVAWT